MSSAAVESYVACTRSGFTSFEFDYALPNFQHLLVDWFGAADNLAVIVDILDNHLVDGGGTWEEVPAVDLLRVPWGGLLPGPSSQPFRSCALGELCNALVGLCIP